MNSLIRISVGLGFWTVISGCSGKEPVVPIGNESIDANDTADVSGPDDETVAADTAVSPSDVNIDDTFPSDADTPSTVASPVRIGVSRVRIPLALGIGMPGFFQLNPSGGGTKSPYTGTYPATRKIYTHPTFHVVAVQNATDTVVMLRTDTIGLTQELRGATVARIIEMGGPDLSDELIMAATHTHTGPGRLVDNELWAAITDSFSPRFFERAVQAMADAVLKALDDLAPGSFGYTFLNTNALHKDRRCQNADLLDGTLPLLRFDDALGKPKAIVAMYAVHGTSMSAGLNTLSRDFHGAMELKLEERFSNPVTVLFFNSWSGDVGDKLGEVDDDLGVLDVYNGMEAAGNTFADLVMGEIESIEMHEMIGIRSRMARVPLNLEVLGYEPGEFDWEYGAVYCGFGADTECFGGMTPDPYLLTINCVPFPESDPAPQDTVVGFFELGELVIATMAGEPLTEIGLRIVNDIRQKTGRLDVALLGYAQDYIGYNLSETDWFYGDYETSGALWGPKQGDYLAARTIEWAVSHLNGSSSSWTPLGPKDAPKYDPPSQVTEMPVGIPEVLIQPKTTLVVGDLVEATFAGGDPWWLAPIVTLERQSETGDFVIERYPNGRPVDSNGYEFELELEVTPTYEDSPGPVARQFAWTARMAPKRPASTTAPDRIGGTFRFRIVGATSADDTYELTTDPFTIE
jgi:hypothetical protein